MIENIAVIGGGLAGTSAAHTLVEQGYSVTIIEKHEQLGGRIHSELVDDAAIEMGAGFLTSDYTNVLAFLATTGLDSQLYRQNGSAAIFRDERVQMITLGALASNRPLSWGAKIHALPLLLKTLSSWSQLDSHAFWRADKYDERSVSDMFTSAGGKEFLEYALQPILNGYFYWTPEHTSEAMLRVLCKAAFSHGTYKMQGGLQRIPEKAAASSTTLLGHTVQQVRPADGRSYDIAIEHKGKSRVLKAAGVVCATTATGVSKIFPELSERQRRFFEAVKYSSAALVARTYKGGQTRGDKAVAFPRQEGTELSAITLSPEPGAPGETLATLKTYASGVAAMRLCGLSDEALAERLVAAMQPARHALLIGDPNPLAIHLQRWPEALPFFDVGHFKRLRAFESGEIEDQSQAIAFAGDYIGGPFMEGAFTSGMRAAERLDGRLRRPIS